jgi:hypothetical protein
MTPFPPAHPNQLRELFEARLQVLASAHRNYRAAAHRFLTYLQTHFAEVHRLSDLRRDPHVLGWFRSLDAEDPPLSNSTRRIYLIGLRRLLHDPVSEDHAMHPALIRREDFPLRPPRPRKPRPTQNRRSPLPHSIFADIFETHIQTLTVTLTDYDRRLSRGRPRLPLISPKPFSTTASALGLAARSPLARLAPLPRRTSTVLFRDHAPEVPTQASRPIPAINLPRPSPAR